MLPADSSRRLVAELRGALDACAERQRELERSLRVSRRLLRAWDPAETPAPEPSPGRASEDPAAGKPASPASPAHGGAAPPRTVRGPPPAPALPPRTPTPQELKELELLTQALEKAVRVRKDISKAGQRSKTASLKSGSQAAAPAPATAVPPGASGRAGSRAAETRPSRGGCRASGPARTMTPGPQATKTGPGLRDQHEPPSADPHSPEVFRLKEKGTLLQLPSAYRKAASLNTRLWTQLSSTSMGDARDAAAAAKNRFLQTLQAAPASSTLSVAEVEAEVARLRAACSLLRLRQDEVLAADPGDWKQEYRRLLTLDGLGAMATECLQRLQDLRTVAEQQPEPWPEGRPPGTPLPCGPGTDPLWHPQRLLYSSTRELQALADLRLRVAMLKQQLHLQKVLMAELLPLVCRTEPPDLALCRAAHSLLCEGGQHFLCVLRDEAEPVD
ncbi:tubulin epsilon and delta complex protein 2 isoform X2 [Erinaceus europaeus]|uniref:Tubulin epsilon and delta complex protein 2 isoform X2 n=1 Tax=Erinaceus europaeus TaxID=9365 RepID=A0ABM3VWD0_ERIEU|nr:tubulin epsilon and delta complex protein 2 isoform X2 [Erinaceus europaeus]